MESNAELVESLPAEVDRPARIGEIVERPAITVEDRQNRMISLATDLAEQQLIDGTASSQVITHFLKLGTEQARLECEKLKYETIRIQAQTKVLEAVENSEAKYQEAIDAMRRYQGQIDETDQDVR